MSSRENPADFDGSRRILLDDDRRRRDRQLVGALARLVAVELGLSPRRILDTRRGSPEVARARMIVAYLACVSLELSRRAVGRALRRRRTPIRHALAQIEERRDDPAFDAWLGQIEAAAIVFRPEECRDGPPATPSSADELANHRTLTAGVDRGENAARPLGGRLPSHSQK